MTRTTNARRIMRILTSTTLAGAGGLHIAWGRGSTFPFGSKAALNEHVVGSSKAPSRAACNAVAAALGIAAIANATAPRSVSHRHALRAIALVFATRAAFGFAGRTDLLMPGSTSADFRRLDRMVYSPICAFLAAGTASAARTPLQRN